MQSIRRYRDNKLKWNLVNAAKYVSIMIQSSLYITYKVTNSNRVYWAYVIYASFNTIYCVLWDYYMDWGLLRSFQSGTRFLRSNKLLYPKWFYYFGLVMNFPLRCLWYVQVAHFEGWEADPNFYLFIFSVGEGFRRMIWTLLRVENENVNNFEKYRTILQIPAYREEFEED